MSARIETGITSSALRETTAATSTRRVFLKKSADIALKASIAGLIPATYYSRVSDSTEKEILILNNNLRNQKSPSIVSGIDAEIEYLKEKQANAQLKTERSLGAAVVGTIYLYVKDVFKNR
jgi:hypothetical protein